MAMEASVNLEGEMAKTYGRMNAVTKKANAFISSQLDKVESSEILSYYAVGETIAKMMDSEDKYGDGAVMQVAASLADSRGGTPESRQNRLYEYARFYRTFDKSFIKDIVAKSAESRGKICFGHFTIIMG